MRLAVGRRVAVIWTVDLDVADVPFLARGVHLDRDRGAGGERRRGIRVGEGPGRRRLRLRLVDRRACGRIDLDVVRVAAAPAACPVGLQSRRGPRTAPGPRRRSRASHRVDGVGGAVEIAEDLGCELLLRRGPTTRRSARRIAARATSSAADSGGPAGDHELRRQVDPIHVVVDHASRASTISAGHPADAVLEAPGGLGRRRQLGAGDEQLVLDPRGCRGDPRASSPQSERGDAERRAGLVDRPVRLGPGVGLRDPAAVPERGRPVVALLRVDLRHGSDPRGSGAG